MKKATPGRKQQRNVLKQSGPSAAALVVAVARGDWDAEAAIIKKYGPALMYILQREVRDQSVAQDLYQQSFLIVIQRLRKRGLDEPDKLAAFLLGVARHLVKAYRRGAARFLEAPDVIQNMEDQAPSPYEQASHSQELKSVRAAIQRLSVPRDRDLLTRCYLMGEDKEIICEALGLDSRQFNRAIHRARLRLKKEICIAWSSEPEACCNG